METALLQAQLDQIDVAADDLLLELAESLSDDLRRIAKLMLGGALWTDRYPRPLAGITGATPTREAAASPLRWAPRILALCCQAYGQPQEVAIPVGACFEILGVVSSALDAVQDRHQDLLSAYSPDLPRPNLSRREMSRHLAVVSNAGTALIGLAWRALLDYGGRYGLDPARAITIGQLIANDWGTVCSAQHLDLTRGRSLDITLEEYDQVLLGKAGAIGGCACEAAALLSGATRHHNTWRLLGTERTLAQQLCDDFNDLEQDLASGQQLGQAVLYSLLVSDAAQRRDLLELLGQAEGGETSATAARQAIICRLDALGGVHYVLASLALRRQRALQAVRTLQLPGPYAAELRDWVLRVAPPYATEQLSPAGLDPSGSA
jgi:hypothetical protein